MRPTTIQLHLTGILGALLLSQAMVRADPENQTMSRRELRKVLEGLGNEQLEVKIKELRGPLKQGNTPAMAFPPKPARGDRRLPQGAEMMRPEIRERIRQEFLNLSPEERERRVEKLRNRQAPLFQEADETSAKGKAIKDRYRMLKTKAENGDLTDEERARLNRLEILVNQGNR